MVKYEQLKVDNQRTMLSVLNQTFCTYKFDNNFTNKGDQSRGKRRVIKFNE